MKLYAIVHKYDNEVRIGSDLQDGFDYPRCMFNTYNDRLAMREAEAIINREGYVNAVLVRQHVYPVPALVAVAVL